jgi:mannose/cellobiose epimerase-like protein (N-acyl-D-glucosamine 2-epimerase family)
MIEILSSIDEINDQLAVKYLAYLRIRAEFLLGRYVKYPDFPGIQTGYNSITGIEFAAEYNLPYSWINGRGVGVLSRLAEVFPQHRQGLLKYAAHTIKWLDKHYQMNNRHFPFIANLDGTEKPTGSPCPKGYKSLSDLYCGIGYLDYGRVNHDAARIATTREIFAETMSALRANKFATEPDATPADRILGSPHTVALDYANEMYKQLGEFEYLAAAADLAAFLLDYYYLPNIKVFIEYITTEHQPLANENGDYLVDPGHAIEFCSFALEFSRLAEKIGAYGLLCAQINQIVPDLIIWNVEKGWNEKYYGIYKTIEAISGRPVNTTMPWWILPETMLALLLGYERTKQERFLAKYVEVHNTYFKQYINEKTDFGPYQNLDGTTGKPIDIVPACKFQDPEFHSGKNILTSVQVMKRIGKI